MNVQAARIAALSAALAEQPTGDNGGCVELQDGAAFASEDAGDALERCATDPAEGAEAAVAAAAAKAREHDTSARAAAVAAAADRPQRLLAMLAATRAELAATHRTNLSLSVTLEGSAHREAQLTLASGAARAADADARRARAEADTLRSRCAELELRAAAAEAAAEEAMCAVAAAVSPPHHARAHAERRRPAGADGGLSGDGGDGGADHESDDGERGDGARPPASRDTRGDARRCAAYTGAYPSWLHASGGHFGNVVRPAPIGPAAHSQWLLTLTAAAPPLAVPADAFARRETFGQHLLRGRRAQPSPGGKGGQSQQVQPAQNGRGGPGPPATDSRGETTQPHCANSNGGPISPLAAGTSSMATPARSGAVGGHSVATPSSVRAFALQSALRADVARLESARTALARQVAELQARREALTGSAESGATHDARAAAARPSPLTPTLAARAALAANAPPAELGVVAQAAPASEGSSVATPPCAHACSPPGSNALPASADQRAESDLRARLFASEARVRALAREVDDRARDAVASRRLLVGGVEARGEVSHPANASARRALDAHVGDAGALSSDSLAVTPPSPAGCALGAGCNAPPSAAQPSPFGQRFSAVKVPLAYSPSFEQREAHAAAPEAVGADTLADDAACAANDDAYGRAHGRDGVPQRAMSPQLAFAKVPAATCAQASPCTDSLHPDERAAPRREANVHDMPSPPPPVAPAVAAPASSAFAPSASAARAPRILATPPAEPPTPRSRRAQPPRSPCAAEAEVGARSPLAAASRTLPLLPLLASPARADGAVDQPLRAENAARSPESDGARSVRDAIEEGSAAACRAAHVGAAASADALAREAAAIVRMRAAEAAVEAANASAAEREGAMRAEVAAAHALADALGAEAEMARAELRDAAAQRGAEAAALDALRAEHAAEHAAARAACAAAANAEAAARAQLRDETARWRKAMAALEAERGNVRVLLRVRPLSDAEAARAEPATLVVLDDNTAALYDGPSPARCTADAGAQRRGGPADRLARGASAREAIAGAILPSGFGTDGGASSSSAVSAAAPCDAAAAPGAKPPLVFDFSRAFAPSVSQAAFFDMSGVGALVDDVLDGRAASVLAYGQTGSGKTFTMFGPSQQLAPKRALAGGGMDGATPPLGDGAGLVQRAVALLFERVSASASMDASTYARVSISVTLVELHNDALRDLLAPADHAGGGRAGASALARASASGIAPSAVASAPPTLSIREDAWGGAYVRGATCAQVHSAAELLAHVCTALARRATSTTHLNAESSRSHLLLAVGVHTRAPDSAPRTASGAAAAAASGTLRGKLVFADLAGSERVGRSGAADDAGLMREARSINKSLAALSDVVCALTQKVCDRTRPWAQSASCADADDHAGRSRLRLTPARLFAHPSPPLGSRRSRTCRTATPSSRRCSRTRLVARRARSSSSPRRPRSTRATRHSARCTSRHARGSSSTRRHGTSRRAPLRGCSAVCPSWCVQWR